MPVSLLHYVHNFKRRVVFEVITVESICQDEHNLNEREK